MTTYTQKRVLVIFTGGTVAGNVAKSDVSKEVKSNPNSFMQVLENSCEIVKHNWNIEILPEVKELFNVDSSNILPENWTILAQEIQEQYDSYDAFIVLHGTNTLGYTSAALTFAFPNINKPVILTGAQVPLGYLGSDATTNLVNSLRLAVWGYHQIKGVMAVFGSKIITGARVKKGTDFDYDPFKAFQMGSLGQIGRFIRINESALDKHLAYLSKSGALAIQSRVLKVFKEFNTSGVISLTEFPGLSKDIFHRVANDLGAKGIIFRAFGAGDISEHLHDGLRYLKEKQIPIVITTQAPSGVASFQVNEPGMKIREQDLGIPAYDMSIESMTVKLSWLLAQNFNYEQIKMKMIEDMHGEINVENELV